MKRSMLLIALFAILSGCSKQPSVEQAIRCAAMVRLTAQSDPNAPAAMAQIERNAFNFAMERGGFSRMDLEQQIVQIQLVDLPDEARRQGGVEAGIQEMNLCFDQFRNGS